MLNVVIGKLWRNNRLDFETAWLSLKETIENMNRSAHNPMASMSEGMWTESVTLTILKEMDKLEREMLEEALGDRLYGKNNGNIH